MKNLTAYREPGETNREIEQLTKEVRTLKRSVRKVKAGIAFKGIVVKHIHWYSFAMIPIVIFINEYTDLYPNTTYTFAAYFAAAGLYSIFKLWNHESQQ